MKLYDTYLFDADGTLFDTVDMICECFSHIMEKYGKPSLSREAMIAQIGSPLIEQVKQHFSDYTDYRTILEDYQKYQLAILEDSVKPFPGVVETLQTLHEAGKQLAVVTSRRRYSLETILEATGTRQYFRTLVTPESTTKHKPDAEPALQAMALLGADPKTTVFTGDAHYDICSGSAAGIDTIFVNWSHIAASSLPVAPTWTIDSMQELTKEFAQSRHQPL